jgi:hypothetical protein
MHSTRHAREDDVAEQIRANYAAQLQALLAGNADTLSRLLTGDLSQVHLTGLRQSREDWVASGQTVRYLPLIPGARFSPLLMAGHALAHRQSVPGGHRRPTGPPWGGPPRPVLCRAHHGAAALERPHTSAGPSDVLRPCSGSSRSWTPIHRGPS